MLITRAKERSPDMILTAFDEQIDETKDEIPPRARRPAKNLKKTMCKKWTTKKSEKNSVDKMDPQIVNKTKIMFGKVDPTKVEKTMCKN